MKTTGRKSKNVIWIDKPEHIVSVTPGEWVKGAMPVSRNNQRDTGLASEHLRNKTPIKDQKKTDIDVTVDMINTGLHPNSDTNRMKNLKETAKPQKLKKP